MPFIDLNGTPTPSASLPVQGSALPTVTLPAVTTPSPAATNPGTPTLPALPALATVPIAQAAQIKEIKGPNFEPVPASTAPVEPQSLDQKLTEANAKFADLNAELDKLNQPAAVEPTPATEPTVPTGPTLTTSSAPMAPEAAASLTIGTEITTPAEAAPEPEAIETPAQPPVAQEVVLGTEGTAEPQSEPAPPSKPLTAVPQLPTFVVEPSPEPVKAIENTLPPLPPVDPAKSQLLVESMAAPAEATKPIPEDIEPSSSIAEPVPEATPKSEPELPVLVSEPTPEVNPIPASLRRLQPPPILSSKSYSLRDILMEAVQMGASDVHLTVGYRAMARVDGDLVPMKSQILEAATVNDMLREIVTQREGVEVDQIKDLDVPFHLPDQEMRFRVNVYREKENPSAVFRLIPTNIRTVEDLHLPAVIKEFTNLEQGLILVTGATGSGKSTTIAALINEINLKQPKHIVTIEDPIEYVYPKGMSIVSQRNMHDDTKSWDEALRAVLRQDPDVVLIGEMRDLETISTTMTVAETGHLVFATLHTNSATQSIDRIIDVFPEHQQNQIRTQLANVLTAVVSQKLVPISGGGRRVAAELMIVNPAVRSAIRENKVHLIDNMIQTSADVGMISMENSLVNMVKDGLISPEVAQQYANKPTDVITLLMRQ